MTQVAFWICMVLAFFDEKIEWYVWVALAIAGNEALK